MTQGDQVESQGQWVVLFRSCGEPFGADLSVVQLDAGLTHGALQERLRVKDADGAWLWSGVPDELEILDALRSGRPIGSVAGASLLVLHPEHNTRWDKCEGEVYWGAVEALYAAEPDAPTLDEMLHCLELGRKPKDPDLISKVHAEVKHTGVDFVFSVFDAESRVALREAAELFVATGVIPGDAERELEKVVERERERDPSKLIPLRAAIYAAQLASPRERRALVALAPLVGLPDPLAF